jgi:hypothetical protein
MSTEVSTAEIASLLTFHFDNVATMNANRSDDGTDSTAIN